MSLYALVVRDYEFGAAKNLLAERAVDHRLALDHAPEHVGIAPGRLVGVLDVHPQFVHLGPNPHTNPKTRVTSHIVSPRAKREGESDLRRRVLALE